MIENLSTDLFRGTDAAEDGRASNKIHNIAIEVQIKKDRFNII